MNKKVKRLLRLSFLVTGCFLFFLPFARADQISDLKVQLKSMQENMQALQAKIEELENNQTEMVKITTEQTQTLWQQLSPKVVVSVYGNTQFENFEDTESRFTKNHVDLFLDASLADRLRFFNELDFENAASVGEDRGGAVEAEQMWLEYKITPSLGLYGGVLLVPFGRYNAEHFEVKQHLISRPLVEDKVIPVGWTDVGAGFQGTVSLEEALKTLPASSLNYKLALVQGLTDKINDEDGLREARSRFDSDNNNSKALVGRLGFSPLPLQEAGISAYLGDYDQEGHSINGLDADWHLTYKNLEFVGEYALFDLEKGFTDGGFLVPDRLSGFYVEGRYHFWPAFLNGTLLAKSFEHPLFEAVVRYGQAEIKDDGDAGAGNNEETNWAFGLNYRPVETFVFKFEYLISEAKNEGLERGDHNGFLAAVSAAF